MKCDRCDKEMTGENGATIVGMSITINKPDDIDADFYQKQLGKYKFNHAYSFCFECWLDSLMGV